MNDNEKTKFEKILFSIRMLYFHKYINYNQYIKMMKKLDKEMEKKLDKEMGNS